MQLRTFLKSLFQCITKHILKLIIFRGSATRTINKEICSEHKGSELTLGNASKHQEILECSSFLFFTSCVDLCKKPLPKLQGSASTDYCLEKKFKNEARLQFSTIKTFCLH